MDGTDQGAGDQGAGERSSERESELARKDREWAAKSEASLQSNGGIHHVATGVGPAGSASGTGRSSDPQAYRTPRNLRTSGGPRFGGRGVLAVFGILGVLLTVGIMALLAVRVLDGVSSPNGGTDDDSVGNDEPAVPVVPGVPAVPVEPGVPGGAKADPSGPTDAARAASCDAERATIEAAAAAYELLHGDPPSSVDDLVAGGLLRPDDDGFSHELSSGGAVVPTDECAPD